MMPQPTGRLVRKDDGVYVVLDRIIRAPIEEVWAYFTRSSYLSQWIGETIGTGGSTHAVKFRMNAEGDDAEWQNVSILVCDAPRRLRADVGQGGQSRRMYVHLTEGSGHTTVTFGELLHNLVDEAEIGVGWDYYLDRLIAAHDGKPMPERGDYAALLDHYKTLCRELDRDLRTEHAAAQRNGTTG